MSSTYQSFVKFVFTFVAVNVILLVLRHQRHLDKVALQARLNIDQNILVNIVVGVFRYSKIYVISKMYFLAFESTYHTRAIINRS